jgi:hypothetical protein
MGVSLEFHSEIHPLAVRRDTYITPAGYTDSIWVGAWLMREDHLGWVFRVGRDIMASSTLLIDLS